MLEIAQKYLAFIPSPSMNENSQVFTSFIFFITKKSFWLHKPTKGLYSGTEDLYLYGNSQDEITFIPDTSAANQNKKIIGLAGKAWCCLNCGGNRD